MILGASFDTPDENRAFAAAQQFPFRLLSDPARVAGAAFEVVRPVDDRYADFPLRISYLIDPEGVIAKAYDVADVAAHASEVLADLGAAVGAS